MAIYFAQHDCVGKSVVREEPEIRRRAAIRSGVARSVYGGRELGARPGKFAIGLPPVDSTEGPLREAGAGVSMYFSHQGIGRPIAPRSSPARGAHHLKFP